MAGNPDEMDTVSAKKAIETYTSDSSTTIEGEIAPVAEKGSEKGENVVACLQVLGSFFMMFNSWGIANTFGVFQTYYKGALLENQTPSSISWIGSLQASLLLIVGGLVTGKIFDAGYMRTLVAVGSFFAVLGMMMVSICTEYWQVILAQGVMVGAGAGCLLLPSIAVMPQYFTKRKAFATGLSAAGSSLGGVIYPIVFHKLEPRIGFGWATRVIAFIMIATLSIPNVVMRAKVFPATRRPFLDLKVLRNIPYVLFTISCFFGYMGMYIPFYYISTYTVSKGILSSSTSFYLPSILSASSIFGRLIPNYFADLIGPLNVIGPFTACCSIVAFAWLSVSSVSQVVVFCIFYGFLSGTFVSVNGPALATLSPDLRFIGTHIGMSLGFSSFGLVTGTPVAGALLNKYGWIGPAMFCGTANALAALFILAARLSKVGWKLKVKV